jgi:hypothetical protein
MVQGDLPSWEGPTLQQALGQRPFKDSTLRLLRQAAAPRPPPPGGAGWGAGKDMASGVKLNSRRSGFEYDRYYGGRWGAYEGSMGQPPSQTAFQEWAVVLTGTNLVID